MGRLAGTVVIPLPHADDVKDEKMGAHSDETKGEGDGEREAFDEYADAMADDNRDGAYEALKNMISICFAKYEKQPHEESED